MATQLQDWIHQFEEGAGNLIVRRLLVLTAFVALGVFYNMAAFQNLGNPEGMDAAQLGRNLASGQGYTTDFIRPLSLHLTDRQAEGGLPAQVGREDRHPDLVHPPVYPLLLAGVLRLNPFGYPNTLAVQDFNVYKPDLWIALFNQLLLLVAVWMVFGLARKLFDEAVAWVSAMVFAGAELYWEFTLSGLSTMVLILIFLASVRTLAGLEEKARETDAPWARLLMRALLLGALTGAGMMTRYGYGWLVVPLVGALAALPHARRYHLAGAALMAFLLVATPWLARNFAASGQLFGTASYALFEGTTSFPETELERSVTPDFREFSKIELPHKLFKNLRTLVTEDLPRLGGSWVTAFFLVGLLVPFRRPLLRRLRFYLLGCLGTLVLVQALGRTWVSEETPIYNSDNLLAVVAPVLFIYGVSLFFMLLDQFGAATRGIRTVSAGIFCLVVSAPLVLTFLPPGKSRLAFPPYYPPWIQEKAVYLEETDVMMSDIPWAVAWYGNRTCVWLSRDYRNPPATRYRNDYFAVEQRMGRRVNALYISGKTLEKVKTESLFGWISRTDPQLPWEGFVLDWASFLLVGIYLNNEVPEGFPLKNAPRGIFPELFLVDSEHIQPKTIKTDRP